MFKADRFTHHGKSFVIETENWPDAESEAAAVIALQSWAMAFGSEETILLHRELRREAEALVHDAAYDRTAKPLQAVRDAQRLAIRAGMQGQPGTIDRQPTATIEAD